jgi:uncharacterized membrane protein YeiH
MLDSLALVFQPLANKQFDLLLVIYLVAITAEAMSGALAAGRRNMDIFGVAVIAFVTALGGGTIRDVVLGNYPIGWTQHPEYVYLVIAVRPGHDAARPLHAPHEARLPDARCAGPGRLLADRLQRRAATRLPAVMVVIMAGMLTGICGGILRDVLCNQVPVVFCRELYASVSLFVCALFLVLRHVWRRWRSQHAGLLCRRFRLPHAGAALQLEAADVFLSAALGLSRPGPLLAACLAAGNFLSQ